MIGELQGEFGDLDIKNLKQNIQKCRSQISGSTKDHFAGEKRGLRDFANIQKGLRNYFAAKGWFRTAAKLAFILWCLASIAA